MSVEDHKCDELWSRRNIRNSLLTTHVCAAGLDIGQTTCKGESFSISKSANY